MKRRLILAHWIIDYAYRVRGEVQMYRYRKVPTHFPISKQRKSPIIFLSGFTLRWGFLKHLADQLSLDDYPVYVVQELKNNIGDIPKSAAKVKTIMDINNLKNVIIIGHSKGGLIGKYLLIHHNQDNQIKTVIAIASPFSGTTLARKIPFPSFKEVADKSKMIKEMATNNKVNSKIISVFPAFDNHVWPQGSSFLQGAKNVELKVKGHHRIVFDKGTQQVIIDCIKNL